MILYQSQIIFPRIQVSSLHIRSCHKGYVSIILDTRELTQVNQLREAHAAVLIETAGSCELQRVEMVCEETS